MAPSECPVTMSNHFFKIILSDHIDSQANLLIPRKFVSKHGEKLPEKVYLKVPNGKAWPVDLKRHEDDVWLQKGWPEFASFYSIQFGYMLVFEYQEPHSAHFRVLIFDPSSTEIDYPICAHIDSSGKPPKKTKPNVATKDVSHTGVCLKSKSEQVKTKEDGETAIDEEDRALASAQTFRSNFPCFVVLMKRSHVDGSGHGMHVPKAFEKSYKKWKHDDQVNLQVEGKSWLVKVDMNHNRHRLSHGWDTFAKENSLIVDDVCVFELINAPKKLFRVFIHGARKEASHYCQRQKVKRTMLQCFLSADAFKSKNPFFTVKMQASYVFGGSVHLPSKYITKDQCPYVTLQVSGGRSWLVTCSTYSSSDAKFTSGWKKFVLDNNLAVGDVCVFEQINHSKNLFNVIIFQTQS